LSAENFAGQQFGQLTSAAITAAAALLVAAASYHVLKLPVLRLRHQLR